MQTAQRETQEEVGLELDGNQCAGALSELEMRPRPAGTRGAISPYVFYAGEQLPSLRPNDDEVADTYWIPLTHLWDADNLGTLTHEFHGTVRHFPCIHYRGHNIWGLTFRMTQTFASVVGSPLPSLKKPAP